ncbi:hypothetical protein [Paludisphaera rhizosphaerae]|uniref:hypothetical protein n=1 Tax=Paludisphaera rhizosphaerae TaxID=2711216 RepID=UPI0013EC03CC|nr:hypothetical protein [Paludisphaera rhizosphaerae]
MTSSALVTNGRSSRPPQNAKARYASTSTGTARVAYRGCNPAVGPSPDRPQPVASASNPAEASSASRPSIRGRSPGFRTQAVSRTAAAPSATAAAARPDHGQKSIPAVPKPVARN